MVVAHALVAGSLSAHTAHAVAGARLSADVALFQPRHARTRARRAAHARRPRANAGRPRCPTTMLAPHAPPLPLLSRGATLLAHPPPLHAKLKRPPLPPAPPFVSPILFPSAA
jgi:hypothetical protein